MNRVSRGLALMFLVLLYVWGEGVLAQEPAPPAADEDSVDVEASAVNSLPSFSTPELGEPAPRVMGDIQTLAAQSRPAVVMVVIGEYDATGFLISREPPLVATVAHATRLAAKPEDIIIRLNETGAPVPVRTCHVHSGFRAQPTAQDPYSPDLAILELEPSGLELGSPLKLALPNRSADLRGREVISLGFPTYATLTGERESAESIIQHGIVQRAIDFDGNTTSQPPAERPLFEHSFEASPGESGAPILDLASGQVVGVHHGTRRMYKPNTRELTAVIPVALRVELLWELLVQANLIDAVTQPAP